MTKVVAKFRCRSVNLGEPQGIFENGALVGTKSPCDVTLSPVSKHEITNPTAQDKLFGDATPNGEIRMTIYGDAGAEFVPGEDYMVVFERA